MVDVARVSRLLALIVPSSLAHCFDVSLQWREPVPPARATTHDLLPGSISNHSTSSLSRPPGHTRDRRGRRRDRNIAMQWAVNRKGMEAESRIITAVHSLTGVGAAAAVAQILSCTESTLYRSSEGAAQCVHPPVSSVSFLPMEGLVYRPRGR